MVVGRWSKGSKSTKDGHRVSLSFLATEVFNILIGPCTGRSEDFRRRGHHQKFQLGYAGVSFLSEKAHGEANLASLALFTAGEMPEVRQWPQVAMSLSCRTFEFRRVCSSASQVSLH